MTRRQKQLLDFVAAYAAQHGYAPSYDEMKSGLGIVSKSSIHRLVHALAERGFIKFLPARARSIELVRSEG